MNWFNVLVDIGAVLFITAGVFWATVFALMNWPAAKGLRGERPW